MKKGTGIRWMLAGAAVVLAIAPILAHGDADWKGHNGNGPDGHRPMARMAAALDLTPDQQAQVRNIVSRYRKGPLGERMAAMRTGRHTLRALIHDPAATDDQVQQAAGTVSAIAAQVAVERHHMAQEIGKVLTPEQREKAARMRGTYGDPSSPPTLDAPDGPDDY